MNINIREAVINDYEGLCGIYAELDEQHRLSHPELFIKPDNYGRTKEYINEIIDNSDKAIFVADIDSKVAGFAECCIQKSSDFPVNKKREWVQIDSIAVKKEYRSHHIGSLLLNKITEWAKDKEVNRIELKVYSFNENASDFYSGKGFKDLSKTMFLEI